MSITARMILQMEANQAKAETAAATGEIKKLTGATGELGAKSKAAASAADTEAAAKKRNAAASREMTTANRQAAGATGNLVAQFNDIGMMLAAGQNPLQLAIQQGTQITQVIGPMGAAGAAKALGTAFVNMVSPLNLVTLGVIAVAGTMIQWLTSADTEADALNVQLERQKAALEGIVAETENLRLQRGMMLSGAQSEDEQVLLERNNALLAERAAIDEKLANNFAVVGNFRAAAAKAELEARREAINVQIGANNVALVALEKARELKAETEQSVAAAQNLKGAVDAVASVISRAASGDLSGPFLRAQGAANTLLGIANQILGAMNLAVAQQADAQNQLGQMAIEFSPGGQNQMKYGGRTAGGTSTQNQLATRNTKVAAGGGGGGGAAARDEASALQELITGLEGEIEALRVQDPIQQEMLKHREALAGATEAEKKKVEELIATREREAMLMEGAKARAEFFGDIGNQALDSLIMKGESFNDVLKGIITSLIKAIAQAALFGTGPFGSLFGGGSALSLIFPALKAEGGMVHGPGTGTSDSIPTMLSNGEFVVNAKSTARNRHLLEAINAGGRVGGFAQGGMVGPGGRRESLGGAPTLPGVIYMDFRGTNSDREINRIAREAAGQMVQLYDREGLPVSIQRVSGDPRSRG